MYLVKQNQFSLYSSFHINIFFIKLPAVFNYITLQIDQIKAHDIVSTKTPFLIHYYKKLMCKI